MFLSATASYFLSQDTQSSDSPLNLGGGSLNTAGFGSGALWVPRIVSMSLWTSEILIISDCCALLRTWFEMLLFIWLLFSTIGSLRATEFCLKGLLERAFEKFSSELILCLALWFSTNWSLKASRLLISSLRALCSWIWWISLFSCSNCASSCRTSSARSTLFWLRLSASLTPSFWLPFSVWFTSTKLLFWLSAMNWSLNLLALSARTSLGLEFRGKFRSIGLSRPLWSDISFTEL